MSELYVGNLCPLTSLQDLSVQFSPFGEITRINLLRSFAFVEFRDRRDALFVLNSWDGRFDWRVELSRNSKFVTAREIGSSKKGRCFACGEFGHFKRDCTKDIKNRGVKQSQRGSLKKNQVASTSTWKPVPPPPPPWLELPEDIMANILHRLGPIGLLWSAQKVCTAWRKICKDPTMWRVIDMWKRGDDNENYGVHYIVNELLFRLAVRLSQGQVTEINIENFGSYDVIEYIAERCGGQLRCLRLASCETLCKAIKRFPLLEELHLQFTPVETNDIEAIGKSCPMLKKFALNCSGCKSGILKSNEEALAVAKSMPELRHLQMFGNRMTNEGLEAILNGCPKLVSLDLRQCFNLDFEGDLGKRCAKQIKNLRRPNDSTDDYGWDDRVSDYGVASGIPYFSDLDSYYDYHYDDLDYDDFCDPFQFDGGSEDSFLEEYFGMF